MRFKQKALEVDEILGKAFFKLYAEYGIEVVGDWIDEDDVYRSFMVVKYRNKQHFDSFNRKMETNDVYQKQMKILTGTRESVEIYTMVKAPSLTKF